MNTAAAGGHGSEPPSPWVRRWAALARPGGRALDLASGRGRHSRWLLAQGCSVLALDREEGALAVLAAAEPQALADGRLQLLVRDLEGDAADTVLPPGPFDLVVVTNYLWRPLWPALLERLAPGGVYLHETFADGQQTVGRPSRPDFLLQAGELLRACSGLRVIAYEDGFEAVPAGASAPAPGAASGRFVQRIAAARPHPSHADTAPVRWPLGLAGAGA